MIGATSPTVRYHNSQGMLSARLSQHSSRVWIVTWQRPEGRGIHGLRTKSRSAGFSLVFLLHFSLRCSVPNRLKIESKRVGLISGQSIIKSLAVFFFCQSVGVVKSPE